MEASILHVPWIKKSLYFPQEKNEVALSTISLTPNSL
jgi:hypothetical protein